MEPNQRSKKHIIIELCKATNSIKLALESFMAATKTIETKLVNQGNSEEAKTGKKVRL